ncbi:hypothetical protein Q4566_05595 [Tamlana sp. 2_MG-2023]|nr:MULTISPECIES: hypothetical protein [unclassified Tamlana]MDO6759668.1 hypothetical protein [Tamlana sp. 2_MG-2023]MDO6791291.1 hypothetical protein [Tamlana sp. 1_MG-2023]
MEAYLNLIAMLVAAFSALVVGFIGYNLKVFGNKGIYSEIFRK